MLALSGDYIWDAVSVSVMTADIALKIGRLLVVCLKPIGGFRLKKSKCSTCLLYLSCVSCAISLSCSASSLSRLASLWSVFARSSRLSAIIVKTAGSSGESR